MSAKKRHRWHAGTDPDRSYCSEPSVYVSVFPNTEAKKNLQRKKEFYRAQLATMVLRETVSVGESIAIAVAALGSGVAVGMSVSDEPTPHLITPLEANDAHPVPPLLERI